MPATTSPLMALRFSGRLMVIQNACPRFSSTTLLSVIACSLVPIVDWVRCEDRYLRTAAEPSAAHRRDFPRRPPGENRRAAADGPSRRQLPARTARTDRGFAPEAAHIRRKY